MSLGLLSAYSSSDEDDDDEDKTPLGSSNKPVVETTPSPHNCDNISLEQITSVAGPYTHKEDDNRLGPSAAGGAGPDSQAARSQPSYSNPAVRSSKGYGLYEDQGHHSSRPQEEHHPYEKVDFFIPERNQRIPGKYLRPPGPAPAEVEQQTVQGHQDDPCGELLPGMGTREFKKLKGAVWKDITTTGGSVSQPVTDIQFNTPLKNYQVVASPIEAEDQQKDLQKDQQKDQQKEYTEDDYYNYYLYQYYQYYATQGSSGDNGSDLSDQFSAWFSQHGVGGPPCPPGGRGTFSYPHEGGGPSYLPGYSQGYSGPLGGPKETGHFKQKTFEELQEQDRQLDKFFSSAPNEYTMMRAAFKSTYRGTKTYRENNKDFNPNHFNQLTKGAKGVKNMFPKVKSAVPDRDRYVPEKDLPENLEPKSNKQKKKEAWRAKMKSMIN